MREKSPAAIITQDTCRKLCRPNSLFNDILNILFKFIYFLPVSSGSLDGIGYMYEMDLGYNILN